MRFAYCAYIYRRAELSRTRRVSPQAARCSEAAMPVREGPPEPPPPPKREPPPYPGEKARGGEIILRSRPQRLIFIAGLVGAVLLVVLLWLFAR